VVASKLAIVLLGMSVSIYVILKGIISTNHPPFFCIRHTINLVTGRPQDGAFALYTTVPADKAAILPDNIPFTSGVVIPLALEAAICALFVSEPGTALPGVPIPTLGLPPPSLEPVSTNKILVVYGGSSSVGSMVIQLATAAGVHVIAVAGRDNFALSKEAGAAEMFDYKDVEVVDKVVKAVGKLTEGGGEFVGIVDAISIPETYKHDLAVLAQLGGGYLACTHPPPPAEEVPGNVKAGMIFVVNDAATSVWKNFVGQALEKRVLKCLPSPTVLGKGLEFIQEGLVRSEAGVSGTKLVVEV